MTEILNLVSNGLKQRQISSNGVRNIILVSLFSSLDFWPHLF